MVTGHGYVTDVILPQPRRLCLLAEESFRRDGSSSRCSARPTARPSSSCGLSTPAATCSAQSWATAVCPGQVVGESSTPDGATHAVLWEGGEATDLGALLDQPAGSAAIDVNERGDVLGQLFTTALAPGVLWST